MVMLLAGAVAARAVIFEVTGDAAHNTNAPTGDFADSGWQYQGRWGDYLGTVVAPRFFLTAKHVNGSTNDVFWLDGVAFHPVRSWASPAADLRLWEVAETFPRYAPLYTAGDETGKTCVVFGRGTQRGAEVLVSGQLQGWRWGATDKVARWGVNTVAGVVNGGAGIGELLGAEFNSGASSNECHLSVGDSSGGMFICDGGRWKLAGIHYSVDGPFSNAVNNTTFHAALLDRGGLYEATGSGWKFIPNTGPDKPSSFYSTRISANLTWLAGLIDNQPAADLPLTITAAPGPEVRLTFPTVTNRLYRLQTTTNLLGGGWETWTNGIAGTGDPITVTDPDSPTMPSRFYRLGLDR